MWFLSCETFDFFCKCFERIVIAINNYPLLILSYTGFWEVLMIVSLVTLSQARRNIFMASKMLHDDISLLFSRAVIMHLTHKTVCFDFSDQITPWFSGCVWDVVFGGRNTSCIALRSLTSRCAGQLSIISAIFLFSR